uniref:Uncharacterized protein n=1 Tax=uncultured bacterium A1Q1_fos_1025 TaxID=1256537 RepID=L7VZM8_9BACT|nr:hypothetical protein [uncultured bacterium A1Q1_fos_1025]
MIAKPTSCTGDSDSPFTSQPSNAPVTGAARPSRGGAAVGSRSMPRNHSTNASAVPARLR